MGTDEYFETRDGHEIKRLCPICELPLRFEEFKDINPPDSFKKMWKDSHLAIPCCSCFKMLHALTSTGELRVRYPLSLGHVWQLLDNLVQFGIIDTARRDEKYQQYRRFDHEFKLKTRLKHFLV